MAVKKSAGVHVSWPKPSFLLTVKTNKNFTRYFHAAMLYAHYELTSSELKKEVMKYLKHLNVHHPMLERIKDMNENRFTTVGKYMYILNHHGDVPEDIMQRLMPALEKVVNEEEAKIAAQIKEDSYLNGEITSDKIVDACIKMVPTIQDRLREKAHEVAGEVEGWIDDFCMDKKSPVKTVEDFVNLFKANELKAPHMRHVQIIFEHREAEIAEALGGKNKDLNEGYSHFTKPELKKFDAFHKNLLKACGMMQEVAKVSRAPRKKKPVSHDKLVAKIKYKKNDNQLGIVSLHPVQIIGAREVWVFDVKLRRLTRYVADDLQGPLNVKGGSLISYNKVKSVSKILRKPVEQLAEFKKSGKVQLRAFMENIKAVEIKANGRMNENSIILKIS